MRREEAGTTAACGTDGQATAAAPLCAAPDFLTRQPSMRLPSNACDCHAHVIGPLAAYPLSADRVYTPVDCVAEAYRRMLSRIGVQRAVLVQPSIYGVDNRLMLDTLAADPARLRGVAVAGDDVSAQELARWHALGVRGLRVNLVDRHDAGGPLPMAMLRTLAQRIAPMGWHLELLAHVDAHAQQLMALQDLAVPVVFGHLGYLTVGRSVDDAGLQSLLQLLCTGRAWVKLTGPYRLTREPFPYAACDTLAKSLLAAAPERLVWGTDWPHVMLRGAMPNDADLVDLLSRWLPDAAQRQQVLVDNPAALYDFRD
ncbi:MAG: amidohydrolase family protein [Rhodoferax sp.]|nr:amidohydrolase family protein [Rhodoferax sp.]